MVADFNRSVLPAELRKKVASREQMRSAMDSVRSVQPVEAATGGAAPALDGPLNRDRFRPQACRGTTARSAAKGYVDALWDQSGPYRIDGKRSERRPDREQPVRFFCSYIRGWTGRSIEHVSHSTLSSGPASGNGCCDGAGAHDAEGTDRARGQLEVVHVVNPGSCARPVFLEAAENSTHKGQVSGCCLSDVAVADLERLVAHLH